MSLLVGFKSRWKLLFCSKRYTVSWIKELYPFLQSEANIAKMDERIIIVMGATGSGKSKLIRLATGDARVKVNHGLESGR
jgi:ABC-type lipoprotein export system ATPase subunit